MPNTLSVTKNLMECSTPRREIDARTTSHIRLNMRKSQQKNKSKRPVALAPVLTDCSAGKFFSYMSS